jgi:hypothetical protein
MKKVLIAFVMIVFTYLHSNSQPQVKTIVNDENAEKRNVSNFNGVVISNAIQVFITQGVESAVAISCSNPNKNNEITTEVKNGILYVGISTNFWTSNSNLNNPKVKAYISVNKLNSLKISGASSVKFNEPITSDDLTIKVSGASTLKGTVEAKTFKADVSGASSVNLTGKANEAIIECSGASTFKSFDFTCSKANVDCSGASSILVNITNELEAEATGASSIRYAGNPSKVVANANGASNIKKKD